MGYNGDRDFETWVMMQLPVIGKEEDDPHHDDEGGCEEVVVGCPGSQSHPNQPQAPLHCKATQGNVTYSAVNCTS